MTDTDPHATGPMDGLVDCEADGGGHRWRDDQRADDGRIVEMCRACGATRARPRSRARHAVIRVDLATGEPELVAVFTAANHPDGADPAGLAHARAEALTTRDHVAVAHRLNLAPLTDPTTDPAAVQAPTTEDQWAKQDHADAVRRWLAEPSPKLALTMERLHGVLGQVDRLSAAGGALADAARDTINRPGAQGVRARLDAAERAWRAGTSDA